MKTIESELGWADTSSASFGMMVVNREKQNEKNVPVLVIALNKKEMASEMTTPISEARERYEFSQQYRAALAEVGRELAAMECRRRDLRVAIEGLKCLVDGKACVSALNPR